MFNNSLLLTAIATLLGLAQSDTIILKEPYFQKSDIVSLELICKVSKFQISIENNSLKQPRIKKISMNDIIFSTERFGEFNNFISRSRRVDINTPKCISDNSFSVYVSGSLGKLKAGETDDDFDKRFIFNF